MSYTISKEFHWSSSHQLHGLPAGHPCGRMHGHNYVARVELTADELDGYGFVLDYGELSFLGAYIDDTLDHRDLNLTGLFEQPSAEHIARHLDGIVRDHLHEQIMTRGLDVAVAVSETPKTWATYRETP